jgi:cellulose synthase/poly-beta-1,6-N-acetylglucosamine synthase-like glycosyltransferase
LITVLFSTYNGENTLSKVLNAYSKIDYPKNDWKLVIINNGSNDRSEDIICSFKSQINIMLLYEKKRGKNTSNHRSGNAFHHIGAGPRRPHDGDESQEEGGRGHELGPDTFGRAFDNSIVQLG